jgi:hypothetical protein
MGCRIFRRKPAGRFLQRRIVGVEPLMVPPEGADPEEYRVIKFTGTQISGGLSGAPLLNNRTGGVCGMVKRTRDSYNDRGGFAVRGRVIMTRLPTSLPRFCSHLFRSVTGYFWKPCDVACRNVCVRCDCLFDRSFRSTFRTISYQVQPEEGEYGYALTQTELQEHLQVTQTNALDSQDNYRKLLSDVPAASAILDRLLHHAEIIPINGRSYRLQPKAKRSAPSERSAASSSSPNPT